MDGEEPHAAHMLTKAEFSVLCTQVYEQFKMNPPIKRHVKMMQDGDIARLREFGGPLDVKVGRLTYRIYLYVNDHLRFIIVFTFSGNEEVSILLMDCSRQSLTFFNIQANLDLLCEDGCHYLLQYSCRGIVLKWLFFSVKADAAFINCATTTAEKFITVSSVSQLLLAVRIH